ncbi:MAG: hypothetical protein ABID38_04005 [Candidatus Diapherotrites archaeon]
MNEVERANRKIDRINHEINSGKRKLLSAEEALGKYSKLLK